MRIYFLRLVLHVYQLFIYFVILNLQAIVFIYVSIPALLTKTLQSINLILLKPFQSYLRNIRLISVEWQAVLLSSHAHACHRMLCVPARTKCKTLIVFPSMFFLDGFLLLNQFQCELSSLLLRWFRAPAASGNKTTGFWHQSSGNKNSERTEFLNESTSLRCFQA